MSEGTSYRPKTSKGVDEMGKKVKQEKGFVFYYSWEKVVQFLCDEDAGKLFKALFGVRETLEPDGLSDAAAVAYLMISDQVKRDAERYAEVCESRRKAVRKRWDNAKTDETVSSDTNVLKTIQFDTKETNKNANESKKENKTAMKMELMCTKADMAQSRGVQCPPTLQEVQKYAASVNGNTSPERFHAFFEANGWQTHGTPVVCWQAMYDYWNQRDSQPDISALPQKSMKHANPTYPESDNANAYRSFIYNLDASCFS